MTTKDVLGDHLAMVMHRELAKYHRDLATKAQTITEFNYHNDLAFRLNEEADQIQNRIVFEEEEDV